MCGECWNEDSFRETNDGWDVYDGHFAPSPQPVVLCEK
jgi:hypothetical protein